LGKGVRFRIEDKRYRGKGPRWMVCDVGFRVYDLGLEV